ncbi:hypothetical protein SAMN04244548_04867 [Paracoccus pantotrophus]|nr:hypothetical protein SAMN04244548_04867 [Paracoccus pantotrophus]
MFEEVEAVAMAAGDGLAHSGRGAWRSYNFEVEDLHTYVAGGVRVHNDSQATIDLAGNLGRSFGTQLANVLLEGESQFEQLLGGTILGTITENLAEVITSTGYHMFDGRQLNFAVSLEDAIDNQLGDIGPELTASLTASMASLFAAELGEQLGLEGFGAQLFGVTASTCAGSVIEQLAKQNYNWGEVKWGNAWDSVPGAVGAFFGSSLAHKILPADTLAGSIGGSLGSIAGTSWAIGQIGGALGGMQSVGLLGNLLIPGVGAFIGTLLGTLLGDLFGDDPEPGANFLMFAEQQGENIIPGVLDYYLYATARDGFPHDYTEALGEAVIDLSRAYMSNIGAFDMANANISNFTLPAIYQNNDPHHLGANPLVRVLQRMNIEAQDNGSLRFYVNGRRVDSAEAMVDGAVTDFLRDSQPIGRNIFLKRAVANSAGDASFTLAASMATAAEYERYLEDRATINALIAASPDTAFAGAWAYTLAGAEQLRLGRVSQVDFNGGLGGFLASLVEAGVAVDFTGTTVQRGTNGKVLVNVTVEDADSIPSHINLFAHGARVTETANGATIQFTFNSNMAAVGYKNLMSSTAISGTNRPFMETGLPAFSISSITMRGLPTLCCSISDSTRPGVELPQPRCAPTIPKLALSFVASISVIGVPSSFARWCAHADLPMPGGPSRSSGSNLAPGRPSRTERRNDHQTDSEAGPSQGNSPCSCAAISSAWASETMLTSRTPPCSFSSRARSSVFRRPKPLIALRASRIRLIRRRIRCRSAIRIIGGFSVSGSGRSQASSAKGSTPRSLPRCRRNRSSSEASVSPGSKVRTRRNGMRGMRDSFRQSRVVDRGQPAVR